MVDRFTIRSRDLTFREGEETDEPSPEEDEFEEDNFEVPNDEVPPDEIT